METALYVVGGTLAVIVAFRVARYLTTPIFKWLGYYRYYTPMFFVQPMGVRLLEIHVGTTWDFFRKKNVNPRELLLDVARGMAGVAEDVRRGKIHPKTNFKGVVFYFGDSTVRRLGFRKRRLNVVELLMFAFNYLELTVLYSVSHRRFAFPPVKDLCVVQFTAEDVVANADRYRMFAAMAERNRDAKKRAPIGEKKPETQAA
ncbi:MAG: hypothetical protein GF419_01100 [Ignavibacteriales bacterium]|nr:hypothetical protein [Ignavibacteriales bacterium]